MQLTRLLDEVEAVEVVGDPDGVEVTGIEHDSRRVEPGQLFCCLPGAHADGHRFAPAACRRGATALVCEHLVGEVPAVQVRVPAGGARRAMARLAAAFHGHPARALAVAGVTGTNGKTTVTHLLAAVFDFAGLPATVVGTLSGARTTPESTELQAALARVRDDQVADGRRRAVAVEVSSHALVQSRVDGIRFDAAVFTNLSHDHLDFHGTMEDYFAAKASLFTPDRAARGVVNADDEWGRRLLERPAIPMVAVHPSQLGPVRLAPGRVGFHWRGFEIELPLTGSVNAVNALLAAETALALGVDPAAVAGGLASAQPVPGRLELVGSGPVAVLVDFAHTPAALEVALREGRQLAGAGRVLVVFGCGGDRDRIKRPLMGEVAARLADVVHLTSDNPRSEDPASIAEEVLAGVPAEAAGRLVVELDRRAAIERALQTARPGDVVLVAGKGHEGVQQVGTARLPFDDRQVVREVLCSR